MRSRPHGSPRGHPRYKWIWVTLVIILVLGILFKLQALVPELEPPLSSTPFPTVGRSKGHPSKIAFLFLVRHQMPLDFVWEHFFQVWKNSSGYFFFYVQVGIIVKMQQGMLDLSHEYTNMVTETTQWAM